jgi:RNA polymerase sigma-70 factor (ECF subfamily)
MRTIQSVDDSELPTDAALIAAANRGDGQSFGRLYDRHRDRVFRHVLRLSDSLADAEDLVALVFAEAWRKRDTIRVVNDTILPWLLVTANNLARNSARARRRYQSFLAKIPHPPHEPDHADAVIDRLAKRVQHAAMRSAFERLSIRDREILALCVLEELSTADAALALGIPPGTVKSRLSRAKTRLAASVVDNVSLDILRSPL